MAKFHITVDLDWLDEEQNIDEKIKDELVSRIVNTVENKLIEQTQTECTNKINEQMKQIEIKVGEKLNSIMDNFFDTPRDITDKYGDIIKKDVSVKDTLKEACDKFLTQPLDKNGCPVEGSWNIAYKTRVDYFVAKTVDSSMNYAIEKAVKEIKEKIQNKISNEVKVQIGEKLANIIGLEDILKGNKG